jgi:hypothetical protein
VIQKNRNTFVLDDPTEILEALVGLKNVRVLAYERRASDVQLSIERVVYVGDDGTLFHPGRVANSLRKMFKLRKSDKKS